MIEAVNHQISQISLWTFQDLDHFFGRRRQTFGPRDLGLIEKFGRIQFSLSLPDGNLPAIIGFRESSLTFQGGLSR